jgi:hypothetical protein
MHVDPDTQCHRLAALMSPWLYSEGKPPSHLNRVWIKWIDTRQPPTRGDIDQAVQADLEVVSPVITGFITVRYTSNTYVARAKGHKGTASCTIDARQAAEAMARKLKLDPKQLIYVTDHGGKDFSSHVFNHPGEPSQQTNNSSNAHCPRCGICHTSEEICTQAKARIAAVCGELS